MLYIRNFHYVQAFQCKSPAPAPAHHIWAVGSRNALLPVDCCWLHSTACSPFSWILLTLCCSVPWCIWWAFLLPCSLEIKSSTILLSICAGSLDGYLKAFISWCLAVLLLCNDSAILSTVSLSTSFTDPISFSMSKRVWRLGHLFVSHEDQSVHLRNPHLQT